MSWKTVLKDYFTLTRKDRTAAFFLGILLLITYLLPLFFPKAPESGILPADPAVLAALDTLGAKTQRNEAEKEAPLPFNLEASNASFSSTTVLFHFDPNTLPPEGWQRLGLPSRTIRTLVNYRAKGGRFRKPEDLQKIWGLPEGFYERVRNYIVLTPEPQPTPIAVTYRPEIKKEERITRVELNSTDTTALIALPGIGNRLANRIIAFRNRLGGFYSVEQVGETYGLPDSTFQKIKSILVVKPEGISKLNINTASKEELKGHPYIRWNLANAIVEYRAQHGPYRSLEELKNIMLLDTPTFEKLVPYLTL